MKRFIVFLTITVVSYSTADTNHNSPDAGAPALIRGEYEEYDDGTGVFYTRLSSYGGWVHSQYGEAWRPFHVRRHWRPYFHGRWIWTDYGWYWSSSEPFGWAVYHYGRWAYDDDYGWIWIPDNVWGPAWVEWRYDDDYIGWAPLTPAASFSFSLGITFASGWVAPLHYWSFTPCRRFTAVSVADYVQPVEQTRRFFGNTRGAAGIRAEDNRIINRGIDVGVIERRTKTTINRADIVPTDRDRGERIIRDSNRERIEVYRPIIDPRSNAEERQSTRERRPQHQSNGGDRSQPSSGDRGRRLYDQRQSDTPPDEGLRSGHEPRIRQFRESEQRFEIPRTVGREKSREEQIFENHGRMYFNENRNQQPQRQPSVDQRPR